MGLPPPGVGQGQAAASDSRGAALCLVFTDARGRIVFADNNFIELLHQNDTVSLVGEPLSKILRIAPQNISELISSIAQMGYVRDHMIEIQDMEEEPLNIACTGVATYDDQGVFIGADLTLCDITHFEPTSVHLVDHGDILSARIKEIQNETKKQRGEEEQTFALGYFTAQVTAIQVLLGRMGGPRVREMVETLVNQTASQYGWPVELQGGHLNIGQEGLPLNAYTVLLEQVVDYGTNIIGYQAITYEMQMVDDQMTPHLREMAGQAGLRKWVLS
ncbi:MAG: PAS domain-containing protein [Anaerolineae bacterium]|nr:PAS domain-containing protein [Anaerolineae bacterium]